MDDYDDSLIHLGKLGGVFAHHAASQLLRSNWTETRFWLLISCFNRHDIEAAKKFLADWSGQKIRFARIFKYVPGSHYHALDEKFSSLAEAESFLRQQGYQSSGVVYERCTEL